MILHEFGTVTPIVDKNSPLYREEVVYVWI